MTAEPPPKPPFELSLFGAPDLRDADGVRVDALLSQPKRLALLVRLAFADSAGVERQALLELLWPELDEARARNSLRQSLHFLRRHLGAASVVTSDERVVLDASLVRCDALCARAQFEAGESASALALLTGPLADGLHIAGADRFQQWLAVERSRLSAMAAEGAWQLALEAETIGDRALARRWADRAQEVAPDDETTRRRRISLAARLTEVAGVEARDSARASLGPLLEKPRAPWWRQPMAAWAGVSTVLVLAFGGLTVARLNATPPPVPDRIAVLPFVVQGDARLAYLREGMVDLLAARLEGVPGIHIVDARLALRTASATPQDGAARIVAVTGRLAAGYALTGSVTDSASRLVLEATLVGADGHAVGTARSIAPAESGLYTAVDDIARQLIALRGVGERDHLRQLAARTTSSLEALRAWLEGEQAFRAGKYVAATDAFYRAVQIDTAFGVAHFRYAVAAAYATSGQSDVPRRELTAALRHGNRLSDHDRLMVRALFEDWHGNEDSARVLYRRAMTERPDDAEAWFGLADANFHHGPLEGTGITAARPDFERALVLDTTNLATVVHLARIAAIEGDLRRLGELAARERVLRGSGPLPGEAAWLSAVARGEADTVNAMLVALRSASDDVASDFAWRAASYAADPAVAVRVLSTRVAGDRPQTTRAATMLALAHFESARARPAIAADWLERARAIAPMAALLAEGGIVWATAPSSEAVQAARFRLSHWRTNAGIGAAFGERSTATPLALAASQLEMALLGSIGNDALLARMVALSERVSHLSVEEALAASQVNVWGEARHLTLTGDTVGAIQLLERHRVDGYPRGSVTFTSALGRLERARLLESTGRHAEALKWAAAVPEETGHDAVMIPAMLLVQTRALAATGDLAGARRTGERLLHLWRDAERSERGRLELVRAAMRGDVRLAARGGGHPTGR